jgi:hypothetical protein
VVKTVYERLKINKKLIFSRYEAGKGAERKIPMFEDLPDPRQEEHPKSSIMNHNVSLEKFDRYQAMDKENLVPL